jgi:aspartate kinase
MAEQPDLAVLKFGGSSFIELTDYQRVARYADGRAAADTRVLVVVSGMSGTTGRLLEAARAIDPALQPEVQDQILATAEMLSASFLRAALEARGRRATDLWAEHLGIVATGPATRAQIAEIDPTPIRDALRSCQVVVVAGGQAARPDGRITMLGRNSSDLTAVALAAMLGAATCEIFSDVPGVYSADPYLVPSAALMSRVSYAQCVAMAASGAKVLHTGAVLAARAAGLTITCRALSPDGQAATGTVIGMETSDATAVVGASRIQLVRLRNAHTADTGIMAATKAGLVPVRVADPSGTLLAVAGAGADLADVLDQAGIAGTVVDGFGLVSSITPTGQASRELVPLAMIDARVREIHARAGNQWPDQPFRPPAARMSPHSDLLAGKRQ